MQGASGKQQSDAAIAARRSGGYRHLGAKVVERTLPDHSKVVVRDAKTGQFVILEPRSKK